MNLFPNEEQLLIADGEKVILTNHRIRETNKGWGSEYSIEFFLEDITSVELTSQSLLIFLVFSLISAILGLFMMMNDSISSGSSTAIFFVAAVVCFLIWLNSKQRVIKIVSAGGRPMAIDARKLDKEKSQEFIDRVQAAKSSRMDFLSGRN